MGISVQYQASPALMATVAQYGGYGKYAQQRQQQALGRLQTVEQVMGQKRSQDMQAAENAAQDAARQQQLGLQGKQQQLDQQNRQQQLGLQQRQQDLEAANRQQQLGLQARGQNLDAYKTNQGNMTDLYKAGMSQQGQFARDWLGYQAKGALSNQDAGQRWELEQQQAQNKQDLFEQQFTMKQQERLGQIANANAWVDANSGEGGSLTPDQAQNMRWQLQQSQAGIKPQQIPKQREPDPQEALKQRVVPVPQDQGGGWWVVDKDGVPKYQMPPKEPVQRPERAPMSAMDFQKNLSEQVQVVTDKRGALRPEYSNMARPDGTRITDPEEAAAAIVQRRHAMYQQAFGGGGGQRAPGGAPGGGPQQPPAPGVWSDQAPAAGWSGPPPGAGPQQPPAPGPVRPGDAGAMTAPTGARAFGPPKPGEVAANAAVMSSDGRIVPYAQLAPDQQREWVQNFQQLPPEAKQQIAAAIQAKGGSVPGSAPPTEGAQLADLQKVVEQAPEPQKRAVQTLVDFQNYQGDWSSLPQDQFTKLATAFQNAGPFMSSIPESVRLKFRDAIARRMAATRR